MARKMTASIFIPFGLLVGLMPAVAKGADPVFHGPLPTIHGLIDISVGPFQGETMDLNDTMAQGLKVLVTVSAYNSAFSIVEDRDGKKMYYCYLKAPMFPIEGLTEGLQGDGRLVREKEKELRIYGKVEVSKESMDPLLKNLLHEMKKAADHVYDRNIISKALVCSYFIEGDIEGEKRIALLPMPHLFTNGESGFLISGDVRRLGDVLDLLMEASDFAERTKVDKRELDNFLKGKAFNHAVKALYEGESATVNSSTR